MTYLCRCRTGMVINMTREFVYTRAFLNNWKNIGMDMDDLERLEETLLADPKIGDVIPGTGSARKVRFAYEGSGKSGSVRVIYVDFEIGEKICALAAYAKSDKANLSSAEKNSIKTAIEVLDEIYNRR